MHTKTSTLGKVTPRSRIVVVTRIVRSCSLNFFTISERSSLFEETQGVNASATVVNAKTGEILATTQRPTYNSDTLEGQAKKSYDWVNRLYEAQYEPGSTMKVMLLSSAINNGS